MQDQPALRVWCLEGLTVVEPGQGDIRRELGRRGKSQAEQELQAEGEPQ